MKDILTILAPLLSAHTATVQVTLSKHADGQIALVVMPLVAVTKDNDADVMRLVAALSLPIKITGTAESIYDELEARVTSYVPHRKTWEEQLEAIAGTVAASGKKAAPAADPKPVRAPKVAPSSATAATDNDDGDDDDNTPGASGGNDSQQITFAI